MKKISMTESMHTTKYDLSFLSLKKAETLKNGTLIIGAVKKTAKKKTVLGPPQKIKSNIDFKKLYDFVSNNVSSFSGKLASVLPLYFAPFEASKSWPFKNSIVVGIGQGNQCDSQSLLKLGARINKSVKSQVAGDVYLFVDTFLHDYKSNKTSKPIDFAGRKLKHYPQDIFEVAKKIALGMMIGSYKFREYKTSKKTPKKLKLSIVSDLLTPAQSKKLVSEVTALCDSICYTRDLQNLCPDDLYPETFAKEARKLAKESKFTAKIFDEKKLEKLKMNGILGVGKGSSRPPRLIQIDYKSKKKSKKNIVLVGKGITFDSGGLSLKPSVGMETMKMDMSGAAVVMGVMKSLAVLKPDVNVTALIASAENLPGPGALKVGDVYTAYNGKTVEVLNTDAEGRLVLADALTYASEMKPDCIIDFATLTGAVVVALAGVATGMMGNNAELMEKYAVASELAGEKVWELPLYSEYKEDLVSPYADLQNIGRTRRTAGAPKAGAFLREFVDPKIAWMHLDIAGSADTPADQGAHCPPVGGTGVPVSSVVEFITNYFS